MRAEMAQEKQAMRQALAARRDLVFHAVDVAQQVQAANDRVTRLLAARFGAARCDVVLSGYMSMRSEIDPSAAMASHPGPVCVPVIRGKGQPLEFHRWTSDADMIDGPFKARIPARQDMLVPQVLIVPLLGFDRRGFRLGYGGGFYDRTLEGLRRNGPVLAIGLAFDAQEVVQVPTEATDQRLDAIVTSSREIWPEQGYSAPTACLN